MSNPSITADKTPWYQWDTGLTVTVSGGAMTECHFANRKQGTAYVQAVINGIARVPDELLQVAAPIKAYGYVSDGAGGQTYIEQTFEVIARNIPTDYTYTKTAQKTIRDAEVARDEAVQASKDAKASALAADDSAIEASKSAQSAGESASAAATSASNAAKSAGEAATSASDAKAAAGKVVEDASELLKTYTDNAKTSADNAATSASNAADAASAASGSASAAEQSATDASNAKAAAQTAKAEAEAAKSEAATSASNAESSATAAAKSASDAAASVGAINVIAPKSVDVAPTMVGGDSLAIGRGAKASDKGNYSVVIGSNAHAHAIGTVAIGPGAVDTIDTKGQNVIIGNNAQVNGEVAGSVVLGSYSIAVKDAEVAVGHGATDTGIAETTREITHVSTPTAPTSASNKNYTDDNDAKTLREAKKYTDDNTTNALIGKVSGKLLHVEDAWPSPLLNVTIDGAYKQDGTPSPENPVPIVVVEKPTLYVTGKNLVQSYLVDNATSRYAVVLSAFAGICESQHFQVSFNSDSIGNKLYFNENIFNYLQVTVKQTNSFGITTLNSVSKSSTSQYDRSRGWLLLKNDADNQQALTVSDFQIAYGDTPTGYAPYNGRPVSITLPAEHPYLAALPDGTHDEIVIDKDGNASLIARVWRNTLTSWKKSIEYFTCDINPNRIDNVLICTVGVKTRNERPGDFFVGTALGTVAYKPLDGDTPDSISAKKWLCYYKSTPVTYQLGKLDIPSLPETISNVWTDAELTTNMSMTYKQDVNTVIANLSAQIAALKGTTNEPPEITDPTTE